MLLSVCLSCRHQSQMFEQLTSADNLLQNSLANYLQTRYATTYAYYIYALTYLIALNQPPPSSNRVKEKLTELHIIVRTGFIDIFIVIQSIHNSCDSRLLHSTVRILSMPNNHVLEVGILHAHCHYITAVYSQSSVNCREAVWPTTA